MKKVILTIIGLLAINQATAQVESVETFDKGDKVSAIIDNFEWHASIENNHLWRGLIISDMPAVTSSLSYYFDKNKQWRVGLWGATAVSAESDGTHYKEIDYFVEYNSKHFTIGLWDLFNTRSVEKPEVFNYKEDETTHILDLRTAYYLGDSFPMSLQANVLLYGTADQEIDENLDNDQIYSTYVEASYPIYKRQNLGVDLYVGGAFSFAGDSNLYIKEDKSFDIVNVGLNVSKDVHVASLNFPVSGGFMWNPSQEYTRLHIAADLF